MKPLIFFIFSCGFAGNAMAQKPEVFTTNEGAIRGYDPVAYFNEGTPIKGLIENAFTWNGQTWHFSSTKNLELFSTAPEKYAPQYGGYCAYGLSRGYKAETQPDAWTIVNGKLYLNYNITVRTEWNKNQEERIIKADENWPALKNK